MLDKNGTRQLAYVVTIDEIKPIPGRDRVECAVVGGWTIMVRKGEFKPGDPAIYFEIDSKVPEKEPFEFLAPKHYQIKTQKYKTPEGHFWSQGLIMSANDLGWKIAYDKDDSSGDVPYIVDNKGEHHYAGGESRFLTAALDVTYAEAGDNLRKAAAADKYKNMAARQGKRFSHQPYRWLMKRTWGKKLLFLFFGKKKDKKSSWPAWVKKTDEERIQNMPYILNDKTPWVVTEKIDGTSTTFTIKRKKFNKKKFDFYICSRNVVFDVPNKKCFYETNVYQEMAEKYQIQKKMSELMLTNAFKDCDWMTIQGETYGAGIQARDYSIKDHDFKAFNFITSSTGRWGSVFMKRILETNLNIPCVPILNTSYVLPDTVEELLSYATGKSVLDNQPREGLVFRSPDGSTSFKAVSNEYLTKYHR